MSDHMSRIQSRIINNIKVGALMPVSGNVPEFLKNSDRMSRLPCLLFADRSKYLCKGYYNSKHIPNLIVWTKKET